MSTRKKAKERNRHEDAMVTSNSNDLLAEGETSEESFSKGQKAKRNTVKKVKAKQLSSRRSVIPELQNDELEKTNNTSMKNLKKKRTIESLPSDGPEKKKIKRDKTPILDKLSSSKVYPKRARRSAQALNLSSQQTTISTVDGVPVNEITKNSTKHVKDVTVTSLSEPVLKNVAKCAVLTTCSIKATLITSKCKETSQAKTLIVESNPLEDQGVDTNVTHPKRKGKKPGKLKSTNVIPSISKQIEGVFSSPQAGQLENLKSENTATTKPAVPKRKYNKKSAPLENNKKAEKVVGDKKTVKAAPKTKKKWQNPNPPSIVKLKLKPLADWSTAIQEFQTPQAAPVEADTKVQSDSAIPVLPGSTRKVLAPKQKRRSKNCDMNEAATSWKPLKVTNKAIKSKINTKSQSRNETKKVTKRLYQKKSIAILPSSLENNKDDSYIFENPVLLSPKKVTTSNQTPFESMSIGLDKLNKRISTPSWTKSLSVSSLNSLSLLPEPTVVLHRLCDIGYPGKAFSTDKSTSSSTVTLNSNIRSTGLPARNTDTVDNYSDIIKNHQLELSSSSSTISVVETTVRLIKDIFLESLKNDKWLDIFNPFQEAIDDMSKQSTTSKLTGAFASTEKVFIQESDNLLTIPKKLLHPQSVELSTETDIINKKEGRQCNSIQKDVNTSQSVIVTSLPNLVPNIAITNTTKMATNVAVTFSGMSNSDYRNAMHPTVSPDTSDCDTTSNTTDSRSISPPFIRDDHNRQSSAISKLTSEVSNARQNVCVSNNVDVEQNADDCDDDALSLFAESIAAIEKGSSLCNPSEYFKKPADPGPVKLPSNFMRSIELREGRRFEQTLSHLSPKSKAPFVCEKQSADSTSLLTTKSIPGPGRSDTASSDDQNDHAESYLDEQLPNNIDSYARPKSEEHINENVCRSENYLKEQPAKNTDPQLCSSNAQRISGKRFLSNNLVLLMYGDYKHRPTLFFNICRLFLDSECNFNNFTCKFKHITIIDHLQMIKESKRLDNIKIFASEYIFMRSFLSHMRCFPSYMEVFAEICIKKNWERFLLEIAMDAYIKRLNPEVVLNKVLIFLNTVDINRLVALHDLLGYTISNKNRLIHMLLEAITNEPTIENFKCLLFNLLQILRDFNEKVLIHTAVKLVEWTATLPPDVFLLRKIYYTVIRNTNQAIYSNKILLDRFSTKLWEAAKENSKFRIIHRELLESIRKHNQLNEKGLYAVDTAEHSKGLNGNSSKAEHPLVFRDADRSAQLRNKMICDNTSPDTTQGNDYVRKKPDQTTSLLGTRFKSPAFYGPGRGALRAPVFVPRVRGWGAPPPCMRFSWPPPPPSQYRYLAPKANFQYNPRF